MATKTKTKTCECGCGKTFEVRYASDDRRFYDKTHAARFNAKLRHKPAKTKKTTEKPISDVEMMRRLKAWESKNLTEAERGRKSPYGYARKVLQKV